MHAALVLAWCAVADAAVTADTAREQRWAEQIVPQILVGDAVSLAAPRHPRVPALFTAPRERTRNAVVIVHGQGVNPDWNLIGDLSS